MSLPSAGNRGLCESSLGELSCSDPIENNFSNVPQKFMVAYSVRSKVDSEETSPWVNSRMEADYLSGKAFSPYPTVTRNLFLPLRKSVGVVKGKEGKDMRKGNGEGRFKGRVDLEGSVSSIEFVLGDVPDSDVVKGNGSFWAKEREGVAFKLWEKAVAYVAEGGGLNNQMVEAIVAREERDKSVKELKGVNNNGGQ